MNKPIVSIKNFSLKIGNKQIVKQLDFEVFPGEVFAFLGSNGSGKTSTIRSLLGIYQASSGELLINGEKLTPETAAIVGYLPEERGLYTRAKVLDAMIYFGELKGMDREEARKEALAFLNRARKIIEYLGEKEEEKVKAIQQAMADTADL